MELRQFGRTEHMSSVAIFGTAAIGPESQQEADRAMEKILAAGVNHIDIAPSYGSAEELIGPWIPQARDQFFLGCKTMERTKDGAAAELRRSLEKLQIERFDLYQLHAVNSLEELDKATVKGGALEAILAARDQGLTRYVGITGHGHQVPTVMLEALRRFDFDSVLFPINAILYGMGDYRKGAEEVLRVCAERNIGSMIIKSVAKDPWGERAQTYNTWYEPFDQMPDIQRAVNFSLSQPVTGLCSAGDVRLLSAFLQACEDFSPMTEVDQMAAIEAGKRHVSFFED